VTDIVADSPAEQAGFEIGDRVTSINGNSIQRFEELQQLVRIKPGELLAVVVERDGTSVDIDVTPRIEVEVLPDGLELEYGVLGIRGMAREYVRHTPFIAMWQAIRETGRTILLTFTALGQMISGDRSTDQLGGPIQIAQMSESAAAGGLDSLIFFAAFLSINLGLINLFPIPLLDGGHLVFYLYEAVFRKPMGIRVQEIGFRIGLVLVLGLMLFATRNDLVRLPLIKRIVESIT
jgi:regulator of sigma E protease